MPSIVMRGMSLALHEKEFTLQNLMGAWFEAARFAADSQRVVALRMMRLAGGGPLATTEATRMVAEKMVAFTESQAAVAATMMMGGSFETAATKAYAPYRRAVRANNRRLGP
jgi:hypothetical protein